jgi:hypothetical protein
MVALVESLVAVVVCGALLQAAKAKAVTAIRDKRFKFINDCFTFYKLIYQP